MKPTQVNFTWAMPGGMWVRRENGSVDWDSWDNLADEFTLIELDRLRKIAYNNGMCGMWFDV